MATSLSQGSSVPNITSVNPISSNPTQAYNAKAVEEFKVFLFDFIKRYGITQMQLAAETGVSGPVLSLWKTGKQLKPEQIETLRQWCELIAKTHTAQSPQASSSKSKAASAKVSGSKRYHSGLNSIDLREESNRTYSGSSKIASDLKYTPEDGPMKPLPIEPPNPNWTTAYEMHYSSCDVKGEESLSEVISEVKKARIEYQSGKRVQDKVFLLGPRGGMIVKGGHRPKRLGIDTDNTKAYPTPNQQSNASILKALMDYIPPANFLDAGEVDTHQLLQSINDGTLPYQPKKINQALSAYMSTLLTTHRSNTGSSRTHVASSLEIGPAASKALRHGDVEIKSDLVPSPLLSYLQTATSIDDPFPLCLSEEVNVTVVRTGNDLFDANRKYKKATDTAANLNDSRDHLAKHTTPFAHF
jgi:transcriptional regulator with XRE-family HTH domain